MATSHRSGSDPGSHPRSGPGPARDPRSGTAATGSGTAVERAEAVLVEKYPQLVRLAYLTLPDTLGRHARVLLAHRAVQRALPRAAATGAAAGAGPDGPGGPLAEVRVRVLRAALAPAGRIRASLGRIGRPPVPPFVWGLRLWPPAGGIDEADRVLAGTPGPVRASFALHRLDGVPEEAVVRLLRAAGAGDPADAVRAALAVAVDETLLHALRNPEFDASVVSARPSDLLRRRRRVRAGWAATAALAVVTGALASGTPAPGPVRAPAAGPAAAGALDPARLVRVPAEAWADTARVDFTAWPARGGRTADAALLARALGAWADPPDGVPVTAAPGASTAPPAHSPRLLYAGDADGRAVVLLGEGDRVVRYAEPVRAEGAGRGRELHFARTDEAGVTTAAALVLTRAPGGATARYLLAPWIARAGTRDLLRAGDGTAPLAVAADGVTAPAEVPRTGGACATSPVLELTSSPRIVEKHAFVLADLGALSPVHLTHTPLPDEPGAVPARQPREATGPAARAAWAAAACRLGESGGGGVRAVNIWDFAAPDLPDGGGRAVWSCTRASAWAGTGDVLVQLRPPAGPAQDVVRVRDTAACGRFGQHVLAGTRWRSPACRTYLLAAGSREVTGITATGAVRAEANGRSLVVPAGPAGTPVALTGRLAGGGRITALDGADGGRDRRAPPGSGHGRRGPATQAPPRPGPDPGGARDTGTAGARDTGSTGPGPVVRPRTPGRANPGHRGGPAPARPAVRPPDAGRGALSSGCSMGPSRGP
ncbi:hypothetical protein ACFWUQ_14360 [Streptomyces sp. NPDC058662]|uniref:hypothetical protein n=1 Tax=Streptomyces sp. NPDC058662 TaxID=3346583 RepID=UPI003653BE43